MRVFCPGYEMQEIVARSRAALSKSRELIAEVDAALANIGVRLHQPKQEAIPPDLRHLLP